MFIRLVETLWIAVDDVHRAGRGADRAEIPAEALADAIPTFAAVLTAELSAPNAAHDTPIAGTITIRRTKSRICFIFTLKKLGG